MLLDDLQNKIKYEDLVSSLLNDLQNKIGNLRKKVSSNPFTDIADIIRKDRNLTEFIKNAPLRLAEEVPFANQLVIFMITRIKEELEAD